MDLHTLLPQRPVFLSFAANETVKLQHGHSLARLLCAGRHSALVKFLLIFTFLWLLITSPYPFCLSVLPFTIVMVRLYLRDQGSNQSRGDRVSPANALSLGAAPGALVLCSRSCIIPLKLLPAPADKPRQQQTPLLFEVRGTRTYWQQCSDGNVTSFWYVPCTHFCF